MAVAGVRLPTLHKVGMPTAHRTVADRIRKAILAGELSGGTRLVQADLAQGLAVSVTPVREALRDLVAEGLVDFDAFRGATVHPTSLTELEEIYELRKTLGPVAVRAGVQEITAAELEAATSLARAMKAEVDPAEWIDLERRFHAVLDSASRRPRLQEILARLADLSALYVGVTISSVQAHRARADDDHAAMVDAYRRGDTHRAVELALNHLEDSVRVGRDALAASGAARDR